MRARPELTTVVALVVAVLAVSSSGALIAFAAAPAIAIAFWRNALAASVLTPVALLRRRPELASLAAGRLRHGGLLSVLAGAALAAHFACWVPSVKMTTIATATALGATQPVWQALIAVGQGWRLSARTWFGIAVAVCGAVLATGADWRLSPAAVFGDLLAVAGGLAAAVYTAIGERARIGVSTTVYTTVCYGVCAGILGGACVVWRVPLAGYPTAAWLALIGLTVGPQLLGHSLFNYSLRRVSATTISVLILLEVPGAAVLGWVWLGQVPRSSSWPGLLVLLVGVALVVLVRAAPVRSAQRTADVRPRGGLVANSGSPADGGETGPPQPERRLRVDGLGGGPA